MNPDPPTTNDQPRTSFAEMALADLIDAFSSTDAVPGGGSAAALAGAVGVSLLLMVAGLPKTRTGAPEETADLAEASSRLHPLRDALLDLVDRDSVAYRQVLTAFRLPKVSDADKAARTEAIDRATRAAIDAPLDMMRLCQQALRGAVIVASNVSRKTTSDVGVAVELLGAALRGARLNVDINLAGLNDESYTTRIREEVDELVVDGAEDAERARRALQ
ncbi:MAG TPA: cyclodeaminase/cyclohydrolase family protein [Vicinamibacterales bacterium]|nr:cyclodeaminase/cyclohydrolase family protein [Vicinamibacterales bacterium]